MKVFESTQIRNVGLVGHAGAGKTSLAEALLYAQKQSERLGSVPAGTTVSDYDPEEVRRQHSINLSLVPVMNKEMKINLIDTPGRRDFVGETKNGIRVSDGLVFVIDATSGVDIGTQDCWEFADQLGVATRVAFVNKMDRDRANFQKCVDELASSFPERVVAVTLPVGAEADFRGVIDLVKMKFIEENDRKVTLSEIPAEMADQAAAARIKLAEAASEGDDELMMKFLDDTPLTDDEIEQGLKGAMAQGRVLPVLCGSALTLKGLTTLVTLICDSFPAPTEGTAIEYIKGNSEEPTRMVASPNESSALFIFKTVSDPYAGHLSFFKVMGGTLKPESTLNNINQGKSERLAHLLNVCGKKTQDVEKLATGDIGAVAKLDTTRTNDTLANGSGIRFTPTPLPKPTVRMAVIPKGKADEDKIGLGFHRLIEQDPTLHLYRDSQVHQTILEGMGDAHLDVAVHHLKEMAKVEVDLEKPRVPYRETITRKAEGQGKYKKQSGGRGQYGDCWIRFEPLPEGSGFQFEWAVVGGVIPTKYSPAVEKGLHEALEKGVLSGHPTVDFKAVCYDGSHHAVDSSEMAFKVAASMAFKGIIPKAGPVILEPIMKAKIIVPEQYMGDVMGDLSGRRGRILGTEGQGKRQIIEAMIPMSEISTYSRDLRSMTHGAGAYEAEFDHYARVPADQQEKIMATHKVEKEEE